MVGLALCLREEGGTKANRIRSIANVSLTDTACQLDMSDPKMKKIVQQDLHSNMYRDGKWGSFRHHVISDGKDSIFIPRI